MAEKSNPNSAPTETMWRKTGADAPYLARLRNRAEQKARSLKLQEIEPQLPAEVLQVLHELRVHQIELEMQNEELRSAREQLEASRARYFDLYDLAPVGYFTLSRGGRILEANLTAATLLGVARSELTGRQLSRFVLADDAGTFSSLIGNLFKKGGPESCELRMARQGTGPFWAQFDATATQDVGSAPAWRVVISDITERKRAQEESFARQKLESMGTLAGGIAHDFNNLLRRRAGPRRTSAGGISVWFVSGRRTEAHPGWCDPRLRNRAPVDDLFRKRKRSGGFGRCVPGGKRHD